ncbi:HDOD domain-containing protein [Actimicrobium sp. CCC2.4]|uniref:HDOD domain-containing protein n=1 Tax=Actimicrobium sp. CCC2.4 TaxID=3048606 RepID=UPI002AC977A0|nr:HDOD domain-containing protein [Actimicrobium sp. CCC2.4]MEB0134825.1 HDOD domain-containing protein [Actimicrobium sp. CCC2.4]WPX30763.1 HDOD domain-containing protein [Actimicrobium sp. CCC2.4]
MTAVYPAIARIDTTRVREDLLQKIASNPSLPALGSSISQVVQLASSGDEAVRNLAHFVLSDAGLTQKILRLANTVGYRAAAGGQVTTISRAIFMLGFDAVKTSALAMLLVEGMSGKHAQDVRAELAQALCASIVGRELARRSHFKDSEEAAVAALFKNMGRLLVASHDHALYKEILVLMGADKLSAGRASMACMGCSFEALAEVVLHDWQIPDSIVKALAPLPSGPVKVAKSRPEWLQQVAAFSTSAASLIFQQRDPAGDTASRLLLEQFGPALGLDQAAMVALYKTVTEQSHALIDANVCTPVPAARPAAVLSDSILPADIMMHAGPELEMSAETCHPSGKPHNSRDLLLAGVKDVTEMMASGRCKVNDLMLLVLETLHHSLGFRFATICVRDPRSGQYRARLSLGNLPVSARSDFLFSLSDGRDLFGLALANDADLLISDASAANIAALIPAWHRSLLPDARSFIVLPLLITGKSFGLVYADRIHVAPEGVPPDETALIKMLKGQVITALTPH